MDLPALLKKYEMKMEPPVQEALLSYINKLVINVCSMLAALTLFYNSTSKKVTPEIIKHSFDYVNEVCYPQLSVKKGGSLVIDSQYFGQENNAYTEGVAQTRLSSTINFNTNVAREQIGGCGCAGTPMMGGAPREFVLAEFTELILDKPLSQPNVFLGIDLEPNFSSFGVTISNSSLDLVKQVLKMHLNCFMYDLKQLKGKVTVKKLNAVAAKKAHTLFR